MVVREAALEDVPGVLGLWSLARSAHAVTSDRAEDVERLVREMPGSLLVAADDGQLIGAVIAAWDGWRGNMYRLAVHPDHRRHGVARALVQAGEERLQRKGARRISALVAREDEVAAGLWMAVGYGYDEVIGRFVRNL